jgi:PAS domain S-box-containing protein
MDKQQSTIFEKSSLIFLSLLVLFGLYLTSRYSYLLFHSLAELFSIVIAVAIFIVAWNSRRFGENDYLIFIGIAYLFVGGLDLIHTLGYKGMGVFHGYDTNLPTQFWITARYLESLSLLIAPFLIGRKLRIDHIFAIYLGIFIVVLGFIFGGVFPDCFVEESGLTPFKKVSEYIISLAFFVSIFTFRRRHKDLDPQLLRLLIGSIVVTIVSELSFTLYVDVYGFSNLIGHFFKIVSFYLIYKALIETTLMKPYDVLFRDLTQINKQLQKEVVERKQAEDALKTSEEKFSKAFHANPNLTALSSIQDGRYIDVNEAFLRILGFNREEVVGHTSRELNIFADFEDRKRAVELLQQQGRLTDFEAGIHTKSGKKRIAVFSAEMIYLNDEECLLTVANDITERKQAEEAVLAAHRELKDKNTQLHELNASKDKFFSIIAHDLRGPLNSLKVLTQVTEDRFDSYSSDKLKEIVTLQRSSIDNLCNLLENLLTWSRIQQGMIEYHPQQIDMKGIVAQNIALLMPNAQQKQITLKSLISEKVVAYADRDMVNTVVRNLLSNALKFTETHGTIEVSVAQADASIHVLVSDTGMGIDEKALSKLFRIDAAYYKRGTAGEKGTGLGLILCKEFVEKNSGRIWIESEVGKGSTFTFTLPKKLLDV